MAITKKPTKPIQAQSDKAADAFIGGAPDATPRLVRKGKKVQITLTIAEPLLARVDALADQLGQSRAAIINLAIVQMLEAGLRLEGSSFTPEK